MSTAEKKAGVRGTLMAGGVSPNTRAALIGDTLVCEGIKCVRCQMSWEVAVHVNRCVLGGFLEFCSTCPAILMAEVISSCFNSLSRESRWWEAMSEPRLLVKQCMYSWHRLFKRAFHDVRALTISGCWQNRWRCSEFPSITVPGSALASCVCDWQRGQLWGLVCCLFCSCFEGRYRAEPDRKMFCHEGFFLFYRFGINKNRRSYYR